MADQGSRTRSDDEIMALFERVDNRGRWGADDELGTLNLITNHKRIQASRLVVDGLVVSMSHELVPDRSPTGKVEMDLRMLVNPASDPRTGTPPAAADVLTIEAHQQGVTHVDALVHIGSHEDRAYGGRPFTDAAQEDGAAFGSVAAHRHGIYSRGVLLDVAAARDVGWLEPGVEIAPEDLEAAERHAGVNVGTGDVVVVRAGVEAYEAANGPNPLLAGPGPDAAEWMYEREVAAYAGDAPDHVTTAGAAVLGRLDPTALEGDRPSTRFPVPFHQVAIPAMGLCLIDHCRVEELARTCERLGRFEFLFVAAPLVVPGATGSPVNPLALF